MVLIIGVSSLVGVSGSSIPVPPRKPDVAALIQNGSISLSAYTPQTRSNALLNDEHTYRSPFAGPEMDLYRDIFRLQASGSMTEADALIVKVKDQTLMGHVLAQRFLHANYKANFVELSDWLARYADHPEAVRIARLALARVPSGHDGVLTKASYAPSAIEELGEQGMEAKSYDPDIKRTPAQNGMAKDMIRQIRRSVQQYEPSAALRLFNESEAAIYLDDVEKDRIRAIIASGYLYAGKVDEAERFAAQALNGSHGKAPLAGWVHGLAKWQQGRWSQAASSFEAAANSPYSTGSMVAAASYWAARAHEKAGHGRRQTQWLKKAADYPRTFYGLLAVAALGKNADMNWETPELSSAQEKEILETPAGQRAEKLLAAGEVPLAEDEIKALYVKGDGARKKALLAYAYERRLPSLTMQLAHAVGHKAGDAYDAALYPSMPWSPNQGFRIDRALLHAIVRQESRFNASAENKSSGATGLMQLMPQTANFVADTDIFVA
ncbi:MAG: hypothetical protein DI551_12245, partial [Micavibrio aeruginosavorus]